MKIVIAGGSGHLGNILFEYFQTKKHDVLVLTRSKDVSLPYITWDGKTLGKWQDAIDGSDVIINQKLKQRSIVIYDDSCAFCKKSQQLLQKLDWLNNFNCRPLQDNTLYKEFLFLCPEKCREEMKLISKNQQVYSGGDAVIKICSGLPLTATIGWICHLPPLRWLVHWIYLKIAKNRHKISRFLQKSKI